MSEMKHFLEKIRFWMSEYEKENGPIHDDDYEKIFIRCYLKVMNDEKEESGQSN